MITFKTGNILDDDAQALVNPVNCVGTSGAGLAKAFAKKWPQFEKLYRSECRLGRINLGYPTAYQSDKGQWVICFATKRHWRDVSDIRDIKEGLDHLAGTLMQIPHTRFKSLAIPKLGCGLGCLEWREVRPLILEAFKDSKADVRIYGEAP